MGVILSLSLAILSEFIPTQLGLIREEMPFEYILKANNYIKIYIPFYTCDVILEPIKRLGLCYEFYSIDSNLEPIFDLNNVRDQEVLLYTNYFGLKETFIKNICGRYENLIIDNAQSFFFFKNRMGLILSTQ